MRQRLATACIGLRLLRFNALRTLTSMADGDAGPGGVDLEAGLGDVAPRRSGSWPWTSQG